MNMMAKGKHFGVTLEELCEIDERFKKWTDYRPSLLDDANGGRYIEVYKEPGTGIIFVTGNRDEHMDKKRYWKIEFTYKNEEEKPVLLGIFDKEEKKEIK